MTQKAKINMSIFIALLGLATLAFTSILSLVTISLIASVLALAYIAITVASTFKYIDNTKSLLQSYAKGDLRPRIKIGTNPSEVESLCIEANKVGIELTEVMGELRGANIVLVGAIGSFETSNKSVENQSHDIKNFSHTVAAAAEQSSAGLTEVSTSASGMSEAVNSVSAAVEEMVASATEIEGRCEQENKVVKKSQSEAANADIAMKELQGLVEKIGAITQVIEDIASQTNLLALNATIEAAGAGDAGKGFTVVANEVKQLSRQTATATGDIRGQVEQIQSVAHNVSERISQVAKIIMDIESSSQATLHSVQEQRFAISDISQSLAKASTAATQIAHGIDEVSGGVKETAKNIAKVHSEAEKTTIQIASSVNEAKAISQTSKRLAALVNFFKAEAHKAELTPDLYTNVGNVDQQHRRLFDLVNALSTAVVEGKGAETMVKAFDGLLDYTVVHFREEEGMLRKSSYPDIDNHIKLHHAFEAKIKQARDDFSLGKGMVASEVIRFLTDWLIIHIGKIDRQYIPYAKTAGF